MTKIDFEICLNGIKNDINIAIDDLFNIIEIIIKEVEKSKTKNNTN